MEEACRSEIERLHRFFVKWFAGRIPHEVFGEQCHIVLSSDMSMIPPSGRLINHDQLIQYLLASYGRNKDMQFAIDIRNIQVLWKRDNECLLTYQEVQVLDAVETTRQSTVLFRRSSRHDTPCGVEWVFLQETWVNNTTENKEEEDHNNVDNNTLNSSSFLSPKPSTAKSPSSSSVVEKPEFARASSLVSPRRHLSPALPLYDATVIKKEGEVIGIELNRWKITTQQGAIGDDAWFSQATERLQEMAQPIRPTTLDHAESHSIVYRQICLPEMVFPRAHITLEAIDGPKLKFGAYPALLQWAKAHQAISLGSSEEQDGVSVLKVADADLWSSKAAQQRHEDSVTASLTTTHSSSNFHYDWTFSTPHACTTTMDVSWKPLESSGMNQELLQDQTVPILLFDEVVLYEDDLHDNGQVALTCKIRAMPTCVFCLERLWVRVDGVLLRVRETRVSLEFAAMQDAAGGSSKIFRDVVWRQCLWQDLESHGLSTDLKDWCPETGGISEAKWQAALSNIPKVELPVDLPAHAVLDETCS